MSEVGITLRAEQQVCKQTSVFNGLPPATKQQIAPLLARLAVNFPKMNQQFAGVSFWTMLGEQLQELGWSEERVRYAVTLMLQNYKYQTFTAADFLSIDKDIPTFTTQQAEELPANHSPLTIAKIDGKWQVCFKADAERIGLEHREWLTNKEREERGID